MVAAEAAAAMLVEVATVDETHWAPDDDMMVLVVVVVLMAFECNSLRLVAPRALVCLASMGGVDVATIWCCCCWPLIELREWDCLTTSGASCRPMEAPVDVLVDVVVVVDDETTTCCSW